MKIHSYPWYRADWLQSEKVAEMTAEQRGIYRELIDHHYTEGSLPVSERALQIIARCSDKEWRRSWPKIREMFIERDGRLLQEKVLARREELMAWHAERSETAKKAAQKRWLGNASGNASGNANAMPVRCPSTSTSSTTSLTTAKAVVRARGAQPTDRPTDRLKTLLQQFPGIPSGWPPPDDELLNRIAANVGERIGAYHDHLKRKLSTGQRPRESWGWFLAVSEEFRGAA